MFHKFHFFKYQKILNLGQLLFLQNYLKYTFVLSLNTIPKFCHPIKKKDINKLKSMQRSFTRFICNRIYISNTSYNMVKLGLKSRRYRRWDFDLFIVYKTINCKYKVFLCKFFSFSHNKYHLRRNK